MLNKTGKNWRKYKIQKKPGSENREIFSFLLLLQFFIANLQLDAFK